MGEALELKMSGRELAFKTKALSHQIKGLQKLLVSLQIQKGLT